MSGSPRDMPADMIVAERKIEAWRRGLLERVHCRPDVRTYLLAQSGSATIGSFGVFDAPDAIAASEEEVRGVLFALQFAVQGSPGEPPSGLFIEGVSDLSFGEADRARADQAVRHMFDYYCVRDVFLTYMFGEYELECSSPTELRFVDTPGSEGIRDFGNRVLHSRVKRNQAAPRTQLLLPPGLSVQRSVLDALDVPRELDLVGLTAEEFVAALSALAEAHGARIRDGVCPIVNTADLARNISTRAGLSSCQGERFVELITLDLNGQDPLSLFHCPVVPLTTESAVVVPAAVLFSSPSACVPRLAVHRGNGIDAYSSQMEEVLLGKLADHFGCGSSLVRTRVSYSAEADSGDLDLVVYEPETGRLFVGMLKAFIRPDSVVEVARANEKLAQGLGQVERAKAWFTRAEPREWARMLCMTDIEGVPELRFAVIGSSFAGSDHLPIPETVDVVNAQYLLQDEFRGTSLADAVRKFSAELERTGRAAVAGTREVTMELGGVSVTFPALIPE